MSLTTAQEAFYKGNDWWLWSIWINGSPDELDAVESVTYRLHPTFPDPVRTIRDRVSHFRLDAYGWGDFSIPIGVSLKNGETLRLQHDLVLERPMSGPTPTVSGTRRPYHFISYSRINALAFAAELRQALLNSKPPVETWLDQFELDAGGSAPTAVNEAIRDCESLLLLLTSDVAEGALTREWRRALEYRKSVFVLKLQADAVVPPELTNRLTIDFTGDFGAGVDELRRQLRERDSSAGRLRAMREMLGDAERELANAREPRVRARIEKEVLGLRERVAEQERNLERPAEAKRRVEESIEQHLTQQREPESKADGSARETAAPEHLVPRYFKDRDAETESVVDFLTNSSQRLLLVQGHGGTGKSVLVMRVLWEARLGRLRGATAFVDGIVFLTAAGGAPLTLPALYGGICNFLPEQTAANLRSLYRQTEVPASAKSAALIKALKSERLLVVLDGLDSVLNPETANFNEADLGEILRLIVSAPELGLKVIITSRIPPQALTDHSSERQVQLSLGPLDEQSSAAMMRELDVAGEAGIKEASPELLAKAHGLTRGNPRAMEALHALLLADPTITFSGLLREAPTRLSGNPAEAFVAEAFSRLSPLSEQIMQAVAIYGVPVTAGAVDFLLLPFAVGVVSEPVLARLALMHFVRVVEDHYFLHPVDRNFALRRIAAGNVEDRLLETPPFTQYALLHRAAEYYVKIRTPPENWRSLRDLEPLLMEFNLRVAGGDYDEAARVLAQIDFTYLLPWGHVGLMAELYEQLGTNIGDPTLKARAANALAVAYGRRGRLADSIKMYEHALTLAREMGDRSMEGTVIGNLATAYVTEGRMQEARDLLEQALKIAEEQKDLSLQSVWRSNLGDVYLQSGNPRRAGEEQEKALHLARSASDRANEATALRGMGSLAFAARDLVKAASFYEQALKIFQELKDLSNVGVCSSDLAMCLLGSGDYDDAANAYEEALKIARTQEDRTNEGTFLMNLGICSQYQGQLEKAAEYFQSALDIAREVEDRAGEAYVLDNQGDLAFSLGNFPSATECFKACFVIAHEIDNLSLQAYASGGLAAVALDEGKVEEAKTRAREAVAIGVRASDPVTQLLYGYTIAEACLHTGDLLEARSAIEAARLQSDPMQQHFGHVLAGVIALRCGARAAALEAFDAALAETDRLVKLCAKNYKAFSSMGLAHAGLAIARDANHIAASRDAFGASHVIVREPATLTRDRRTLDALAAADGNGVLAGLHD